MPDIDTSAPVSQLASIRSSALPVWQLAKPAQFPDCDSSIFVRCVQACANRRSAEVDSLKKATCFAAAVQILVQLRRGGAELLSQSPGHCGGGKAPRSEALEASLARNLGDQVRNRLAVQSTADSTSSRSWL
jgi:hypothetical protein